MCTEFMQRQAGMEQQHQVFKGDRSCLREERTAAGHRVVQANVAQQLISCSMCLRQKTTVTASSTWFPPVR